MLSRTLASGIRVVGLLVPAVFALSMLAPEAGSLPLGIPEALGCSGTGSTSPGAVAPPQTGWYWLALVDAPTPGSTIHIASDGFVLFYGSRYGLTDEEALAGIKFVVSNEAGDEVPGTVALVGGQFSWSATAPLALGTRLSASLSAMPTSDPAMTSAQYTLDVVGSPPALPTPSAQFETWGDIYTGSGSQVDCGIRMATGCGGTYIPMVSTAYEATQGEVLLATDVAPATSVLWEVTSTQSVASPASNLSYTQTVLLNGPNTVGASLGALTFPLDAEQVCVTVTIKDLRTNKQTSGDVCHAVELDRQVWAADLAQCEAPPTEALRDLWCTARTALGRSCEATPGATDGGIPNDGTPSPGTPGETPGTDSSAQPESSAQADSSAQSNGCQVARPGSSHGAALALALAALGLTAARRRASKLAARTA